MIYNLLPEPMRTNMTDKELAIERYVQDSAVNASYLFDSKGPFVRIHGPDVNDEKYLQRNIRIVGDEVVYNTYIGKGSDRFRVNKTRPADEWEAAAKEITSL